MSRKYFTNHKLKKRPKLFHEHRCDNHFFPVEPFKELPIEIRDLLNLRVDSSGNTVFNYVPLEAATCLRAITEDALALRMDVPNDAGFDKQ